MIIVLVIIIIFLFFLLTQQEYEVGAENNCIYNNIDYLFLSMYAKKINVRRNNVVVED